MKNIAEIIIKYTAGEKTLEETNAALREAGAGLHLDPEKNVLTEADKRATTVGYFPDQANGFGFLESGTGSMEKVAVVAGTLPYAVNEVQKDGGTNMPAFVHICGKRYEVRGAVLVDC